MPTDKRIDKERLRQVIAEAEENYRRFTDEETPEPEKVVEWTGKRRKPRILTLYTGGTLGMKPEKDEISGRLVKVPKLSLEELLEKANLVTGIKERYNITGYKVAEIDSTEINVRVWDNLANLIVDHYEDIDGAIILHGTDTMAYTSAALAFTLRNLSIPVIVTGAQMILEEDGSDVISNLTGSLKIARDKLAGVMTYFNGSVFKGTRVDKRHDAELDGFDSPIYGAIGKLGGNGLVYDPRALKRGTYTPSDLGHFPGFATSVAEFVLSPLSSPSTLGAIALDENCKALVIRSYGPGNTPRWYVPIIKHLTQEENFPVFIASQCAGSGISEEGGYAVGEKIIQAGGIVIGDMSPPATAVKLMKVMKHTGN